MDSVSSRQFREFRDFSAISENHWPYIMHVVSEQFSMQIKLV